MAVVFSPNIIEIAVIATIADRPHVNVWHMWFDSELGTDTKTDVVRDFANNWQDHVLQFVTSALQLDRFDWRSLDPGDASLGTLQPDPAKNTGGANVAPAFPPNVAWLIHKNTDARPRGARDGRCFLAGVRESDADDRGTVDALALDNAETLLAAFYNGISDTSGSASGDRYPAVLETSPASRAPGTAEVTIPSRRVTSITPDPLVASQRDRLR